MIIRTLAVTAAVGTALVAGSGLAAADAPPVVFHAPIKTLELPLRDYRVLTPLPLRCEEDEPPDAAGARRGQRRYVLPQVSQTVYRACLSRA